MEDYAAKMQSESEMLPVLTFGQQQDSNAAAKTEEIQCLKCEKCWQFPTDKDDYLAHQFLEHRLVIADIDDVPLLEEYLKFWRQEFNGHELEEYCTTMLLDQLPDGTPARNERYFLLSDILPKDYELRRNLQQQRLKLTLARHQFERTDRSFSKECLYCRDVITGLRAEYLEHLFQKHFLQLGKPENLVYVDELLAQVQRNLEELVCLYCEKVFKDRITLKEHMRKKAHKRINPNNRAYDKYFLVNYRNEKPKPQKQLHKTRKRAVPLAAAEHHKDSLSEQAASVDFENRPHTHSDDSDSDWSDWADEQLPPLNCLYCSQQEPTFDGLKQHMLLSHKVDFDAGVAELNFYQKIKVVNYVRRQICLLRCVTCNMHCSALDALLAHMSSEQHFGLGTQKQWDKPEYFFPTYEDDGLLCILDDNPSDDVDDTVVRIISEDTMAKINKDAERLSLENFKF